MAKIRILLIEDNRLLREGTTSVLNEQEDIEAVSSPGNKTALETAKKMKPDVVLLDLGLKSRNSLKVLDSIRTQCPKAEVIVMDLIPAHSEAVDLVKAGVSGFIPRNATLDEFLHTIRSVARGVKILPPTMADSLFSQIVERAVQAGTVDKVIEAVKLTSREQEVISLLAKQKTVTETSRILKVAVYTVKSHIRNIMDKLALHTRLEMTAFASTKRPLKKASATNQNKP